MKQSYHSLVYLIDEHTHFADEVENEIKYDSHYSVVFFPTINDCLQELGRNPDAIIMDDITPEIRKNELKNMIHVQCPNTKIIFIGEEEEGDAMEVANKHDWEDYIVKDTSLGQKVKISIDQYVFSKNYNEDFANDSLTIGDDLAPKLILPIAIIAVLILLYIIIVFA